MTGPGGNNMKIGIVTDTDPEKVKCRVKFPDFDNLISWWLPVLHHKSLRDKAYWMPDAGEHVVCMMDDNAEFGGILGAIYSDADQPPVVSQDKRHVRFDDGTWIEYDRENHLLTADIKGDAHIITTGHTTVTAGTYIVATASTDISATAGQNAEVRASGWGQLVADGEVLVKSNSKLTLKGPRGVLIL